MASMLLISKKENQALQAIAVELAFLAPPYASSIGSIACALAELVESENLTLELRSFIKQELHWVQQIQSGSLPFEDKGHERLQSSYLKIQEAVSEFWASSDHGPVVSAEIRPDQNNDNEAFLFIRKTDDIEMLNEFCIEGRELLTHIEQGVLVLEVTPGDKEMLNQVFRAFHTFKGGAGMLDLSPVKHLAHELESLLSAARNGDLKINRDLIDLILAGGDALRSFVSEIEKRLTDFDTQEPVCIPTQGLITRIQYFLKHQESLPRANLPIAEDHIPVVAPTKLASASSKTETNSTEALVNFVKVDTRKLDQLVDLVGELVIAQSLVVEDPRVRALNSLDLAAQLRQLARITTDLQQTAMCMRMIPIRGIFQKMGRLVRDLSVSQDKDVRLHLVGDETEIDRNMVEELADPLMHMIRNAVDHGIESKEFRAQQGKQREGAIELQAFHRDGGVVIVIRDDGRGMDVEHIRKTAIAKGIISSDDELTTSEIVNLIFRPGFSTAAAVTEVSGRGVGMDVVRGHIARLGGHIDVQTTLGVGSEFRIRLPLTLAVIDGMLIRVGRERFILPILSIRESFKPKEGMVCKVQGRGEMINMRGKLVPLVRLNEQLEIGGDTIEATEGVVVVIETRSQMRGILVDELLGKSTLVIKPLVTHLKSFTGITGCSILGDGQVALILDPDSLGNLTKTQFNPKNLKLTKNHEFPHG